jgi:hypothetical protein
MDGIRDLLSALRDNGLITGNFRGVLHIAIGRRISRPDGTILSTGVTWRALATELKTLRFDQELVRELGADPEVLATRDRERFWYAAISLAHVDTPAAVAAAEQLVPKLQPLGFLVGPPPAALAPPPPATPPPPPRLKSPEPKAREKETKPPPKKKKK